MISWIEKKNCPANKGGKILTRLQANQKATVTVILSRKATKNLKLTT
jgi:hypothetical protein